MSTVIAILVGVLVAGTSEALTGLLAGVMTWLLLRAREQQQQIAALRAAVDDLQRRSIAAVSEVPALGQPVARIDASPVVRAPEAVVRTVHETRDPAARELAEMQPVAAPQAAASDIPVEVPAMAAAAAEVPAAATASVEVAGLPTAPAQPSAPAQPTVKFVPPPGPDPFAAIRRWVFGGNTIVKAGVGILFVGLAFLAKYASEHASAGRVAAGGDRRGRPWCCWRSAGACAPASPGYAQVLQGGAVAVLYLTLFVAFRFYGVLPVLPVFVLMVAVAALAAALAVLQDARSLAVIGALGGFATPLLVSTGSGNHVALFSYYLVLDLGIAAVAWSQDLAVAQPGRLPRHLRRRARAWGVLKYRSEYFASSQAFLIAFFLLFVVDPAAAGASPARATARTTAARAGVAWVNSSLLFGLPTITFALQYGLVAGNEYGAALSALALAAFYVGLAAWMRPRPRSAITFEASLAIGDRLPDARDPVRARRAQHRRRLDARGRRAWSGSAFASSRAGPRVFGYLLLVLAGVPMLLGARAPRRRRRRSSTPTCSTGCWPPARSPPALLRPRASRDGADAGEAPASRC